jgi:hypothetical protein
MHYDITHVGGNSSVEAVRIGIGAQLSDTNARDII